MPPLQPKLRRYCWRRSPTRADGQQSHRGLASGRRYASAERRI